MIFQRGRSIARLPQLKTQCSGNRHTLLKSNLKRVPALYNILASGNDAQNAFSSYCFTSISYRTYATRPVSRPKAHTGRTTKSTQKTPTTSAAKKPATKKTSAKSVPKAKSKAKPRIKPKPKPKNAKAKPKSKPKRKVLSEAQKARKAVEDEKDKLKQLRLAALSPPTAAPGTAWMVYASEALKAKSSGTGGPGLGNTMKDISAKFKALEPEQLEHYNHLANQNKAANEKAYRQFIESHSPTEVHNANLARAALRRRSKAKAGRKNSSLKWPPLRDARQVKSPTSAYILWSLERHNSGDLNGMHVTTRASLLAREWKSLTAADKKPFEKAAAADLERYRQERKTVLGLDVLPPRKLKAA
ncbi:MAG: hypothetical protein Q9217_003213 [Psora testacea]